MFHAMVRFILILLSQLRLIARGVNHKWDACQKGQYPSTSPPTYQIIKVMNANHMSVMKTSLFTFIACPLPCVLGSAFLIIRDHFVLSFASKGLGYLAALLLLLSLLARYKLSCYQTTLLLTISALADTTLLLLVGFDTLTYRKDYDSVGNMPQRQ